MDKRERKNVWTLAVAAVLVVLLLLYMLLFTVPQGSFAVVKTLGRVTRVVEEPGLQLRAPWPFQSVQEVDRRTRLLDVQAVEVLTKDKLNLLARLTVGWRVTDARKFLATLGTETNASETLNRRVIAARETAVQETSLDDIVSAGPAQPEKFGQFEARILGLVRQGLAEADFGVDVDFLKVRSIQFPKENTAAVQQRMIAERQRESRKFRSQGENQAKIITDRARAERSRLVAEAKGEAERIRGEGDAEAVIHYDVFNRNPELMRLLVELEVFRAVVRPGTLLALPLTAEPFKGVLQPDHAAPAP